MTATRDPIYIGPGERPIFAWLHPAETPSRGVGLVVCNPFGYEAICGHRSLRHFADAAAAHGVPALRFDYDGTGDSAGDDRDPGRVAAWIASVHHAADALVRHAGVSRVVLLGVRLGATLAAACASERDDVAGLIAIAPVVSGRAYLRELKALQMALGLDEPPPGAAVEPDVQEAVGYRLTAETRDALGKLDLLKATRPPAPRVLILDRADLPSGAKWSKALRDAGVAVEDDDARGYVEMVLDAHRAVVPEAMIAKALAFLAALADAPTREPAPSPAPAATVGDVVETACHVGAGRSLFGILSEPLSGRPARRKGIVILNSGAVHRVGPNRLYVELARRFAARGHAVLRLDIAGIGDSPPRPGQPENVVYTAHADDDVATALDFLQRLPGVVECHALGICSGAYNAFKAAVHGLPLDGVVPINPLTFFWKEGMPLDYAPHRVTAEAQRYADSAFDFGKWKKLLRGDVDVANVAQIFGRRAAAAVERRARDVARRIGRPMADDLGTELETIARRGIDLRFVFATSDPGLGLLELQGGSAVPRLVAAGKLGWEMIAGPDHTFTPLWSHAALIARLGTLLDGPPARASRTGAP